MIPPPVILRSRRTEKAKADRRKYGDNSGLCRFADHYLAPADDGCANTITGITKDNLLLIEYQME